MHRKKRTLVRRHGLERFEARYCLTGGVGFEAHDLVKPDILDPTEVHAADVDLDGDVDVIFADDYGVAWQENLDGNGTFGPRRAVSSEPARVRPGDFDGDGDLDLVVKPYDRVHGILWYENIDGLGAFHYRGIIEDSITIGEMEIGDVDSDGDDDLLAVLNSSNQVVWYESNAGEFERKEIRFARTPDDDFFYVRLFLVDVDRDGHLDVIQSERRRGGVVGWLHNVNGDGETWQWNDVSDDHPHVVAAGDVDGDGDVDLIGNNADGLVWQETVAIGLVPGDQHLLVAEWDAWLFDGGSGKANIVVEDLDGDDNHDILYGRRHQYDDDAQWVIGWLQNTEESFSAPRRITTRAMAPSSLDVADVDGDGDLDVVASSANDNKVGWLANLEDGNYGPQQLVAQPGLPGVSDVIAGDVDGDGDLDLLTATAAWRDYVRGQMSDTDAVSWYANNDGEFNFEDPRVLTIREREPFGLLPTLPVVASDIDHDGDLDVIVGFESSLEWFENLGDGSFESTVLNSELCPSAIYASDMDADGDSDIVAFSICEVVDGPTTTIRTQLESWPTEVQLIWYEFDATNQSFHAAHDVGSVESLNTLMAVLTTTVADIDADGDLDLLTASNDDGSIRWHENRLAGDADDNNEVNIDDFWILAEHFGETETHWADGDLDDDGDVDFADFLVLSANFGATRTP